jgi:hypothetical protein
MEMNSECAKLALMGSCNLVSDIYFCVVKFQYENVEPPRICLNRLKFSKNSQILGGGGGRHHAALCRSKVFVTNAMKFLEMLHFFTKIILQKTKLICLFLDTKIILQIPDTVRVL